MNGRLSTMYALQLEAYRTSQNSVLSGRGIEAAALTTMRLPAFRLSEKLGRP